MSITINYGALEKVEREAAQRVQRAAMYFVQQHQQRLSVSNPRPYLTPSAPGEYPRKRTGALIGGVVTSSLAIADLVASGFKAKIGLLQNVWYGQHLEFNMKRLGFKKTMRELFSQIRTILQRKAS